MIDYEPIQFDNATDKRLYLCVLFCLCTPPHSMHVKIRKGIHMQVISN